MVQNIVIGKPLVDCKELLAFDDIDYDSTNISTV